MRNLFLVFRQFPNFVVRKTSLNNADDLATSERFLLDTLDRIPETIAPDDELFILEFDIDIQREQILAYFIDENGKQIKVYPFVLTLGGVKVEQPSIQRK